ncbi:Ferric-chelate reductase (NADH) [Bertholletia excelsa]
MGEQSAQQALLSSNEEALDYAKKKHFLVSSLKWGLKFTMWIIFIIWAAFIFFYPSEFVNKWYTKFIKATEGTAYGITGSLFLVFSAPILVVAFLGIGYLLITAGEEPRKNNTSKHPHFRLRTFPVIVGEPFGVVSAAELLGVLLFIVYIIWAVAVYTVKNFHIMSEFELTSTVKSSVMLELTGLRFGLIGLFCLAFLFLPVARGSILLRLIDIPFEQATRYHVWLGHLTMALFTLHGLFYVIAWTMQGRLKREIMEWKDIGVANLPGVISLAAGLLMWVTSLRPVRRQKFELFFYTHQLYIVFVVFLALHVGDFIFTMAAGGIFLFILDRFLRFCQSRRAVNIISASCLPCGTVELVLSKPGNLHYNALSFIFLQVRNLSWLQWHPFSVSSSPLEGKYHLSVLIKVLGEWTDKLRGCILNDTDGEHQHKQSLLHQHKITASVEGPYGHESPYHLTYENLILVAGGIGISPFLAILSDILNLVKDGKPCIPRNILVVWAVKKSDELPLLCSFDMESICPFLSDVLNLEIQTYVTRESEPPLETGRLTKSVTSFGSPAPNKHGISALVGTGNIMWSGIYVVVSTIGLVLSVGLLQIFYINPYGIECWWYKGLLFCACMVLSPVILGGIVIGLWHLWEMKTSTREEQEGDWQKDMIENNEERVQKDSNHDHVSSLNTIRYGCRPDFKEIFGSISELWGYVDIGVIVCGPPTLQTSVAKECRSQNLSRKGPQPIFHYNSHSFDL